MRASSLVRPSERSGSARSSTESLHLPSAPPCDDSPVAPHLAHTVSFTTSSSTVDDLPKDELESPSLSALPALPGAIQSSTPSPPPPPPSAPPTAKAPSRSSSAHSCGQASTVSSVAGDICRICHCEGSLECPLITPCYCSGSLKYVHQKCLQQWIKSSQTRSCEVCRYCFLMETKLKPFRKWEKLDISALERRKILCSVTFHIIAITCVVWSLYVLIDRTAEEIREGTLEWPFWTKLVVVAIGFTGGLVFMYVQCKMYVQLFRRWKAYNKVIYVQNCPEMNDRPSRMGKWKPGSPSTHVIVEMKPHRTVAVSSTS